MRASIDMRSSEEQAKIESQRLCALGFNATPMNYRQWGTTNPDWGVEVADVPAVPGWHTMNGCRIHVRYHRQPSKSRTWGVSIYPTLQGENDA